MCYLADPRLPSLRNCLASFTLYLSLRFIIRFSMGGSQENCQQGWIAKNGQAPA